MEEIGEGLRSAVDIMADDDDDDDDFDSEVTR